MLSTPVRMKHISLLMLDSDARPAAVRLAKLQVIHLINSKPEPELLGEAPAESYQALHSELSSRLKKIVSYLSGQKHHQPSSDAPVSHDDLAKANESSRLLWQQVSEHEERIRSAREKMHAARQLAASLGRFENLEFDLGRLTRKSRFMQIFLGTVPQGSVNQLRRALTLANTVMEIFQQSEQHAFVSIATETGNRKEVEEILKAANFHEFTLPPELQDRPEHIRQEIHGQLSAAERTLEAEQLAIRLLLKQHRHLLAILQDTVHRAAPYAALAGSLTGKGQLVMLQGWIAADRIEQVQQELNEALQYAFHFESRDPLPEEMPRVPSLQRQPALFLPFQNLVRQFGIPSYGEIDPTGLFAISYILMFGAMFGDIGHGAVLILIGFLLRHKLAGLFTFSTLTGLSSITFGFMYGSIFGFEELIEPLWLSPMHDPSRMLQIALIWGIGFIFVVYLLSIYNLHQLGHQRHALLGSRGLAGLLFFAGGVNAGFAFMSAEGVGSIALLLMFTPLLVILVFEWQQLQGSLAEKILVSLIETLDGFINNLSNTLSFLRVAAFSLNHVALAAAVFTLAQMMGTVGHWTTIILGNLFIIVLEGGIVAIQCLRLEYYEGFSRFFQGRGLRFAPLKNEY